MKWFIKFSGVCMILSVFFSIFNTVESLRSLNQSINGVATFIICISVMFDVVVLVGSGYAVFKVADLIEDSDAANNRISELETRIYQLEKGVNRTSNSNVTQNSSTNISISYTCEQCGFKNNKDARFCVRCGKVLVKKVDNCKES